MAKIKPRYLTKRPGAEGRLRFFWQPSRELARLGWKLVRLSDRYPEAIAQAEWINTMLDAWAEGDAELTGGILRAWQAGGHGNNHSLTPCPHLPIVVPGLTMESGIATLPAAVGVKSVAALIDDFMDDSEEWLDLSAATRSGYGYYLKAIREWAGDIPVSKLTKKRIRDYHKAVRVGISLATANARLRVLRLLLSYAVREEWIELNPARDLKLKATPPRIVIWSRDEEEVMIRVCDREGRPEIADVLIAALDIGQRRQDLFDMNEGQWDGSRWRVRQGKRGAIVYPVPSARLTARLTAAAERRALAWPATCSPFLKPSERLLFINEATGLPWNKSTFAHEFDRLRAIAAKECPSITNRRNASGDEPDKVVRLQLLDARDTCVTRLAIGGATIAQIRSVTGHTIGSIQTVLKHYLGSEPELAASSAERLTALLDQIEAEQQAA